MDPATRKAVAGVLRACLGAVSAPPTAGRAGAEAGAVRAVAPPAPVVPAVKAPKSLTPGDNVLFCVAQIYRERGAVPMAIKDIRDRAALGGLVLPAAPSNTLRFVRRSGKPMFQCVQGAWQLTPAGEGYMRATYAVAPKRARAQGRKTA